jgi:rhodanese-related sulfurtransferase
MSKLPRCAIVALGFAMLARPSTAQVTSPGAAVMGEDGWRKIATNRVMPTFPTTSLTAGAQGVAVAYVTSSPDGTMARVDVLEAPDAAIGTSVQTALMKWRITALTPGARGPRHYEGRITFYFKILKGHGSVLNPEQIEGNRDVWEAIRGKPSGSAANGPAINRGTDIRIEEVDAGEAARLVKTSHALVVDVRERDEFTRSHTPGAIVMPVNEVLVRSRAEIDPSRAVVVDCSQGELHWCRVGAGLFVRRGFREVFTIIP